MSWRTLTCLSRLTSGSAPVAPSLFLAPAFDLSVPKLAAPSRHFSTSKSLSKRAQTVRIKDKSRKRGVSAIHRTGPRWELSMQRYPLPEPVENPPARKKFETPKDHGLWQFFNKKKDPMIAPETLASHGRAWTYAELTKKSWDDLYRLHWICAKERNVIATSENERKRTHAGYGEYEAEDRDKVVRETQRTIRRVLRDRYIAYYEARDLWNSGARPNDEQFVEDDTFVEEEEEQGGEADEGPVSQIAGLGPPAQPQQNPQQNTLPPPTANTTQQPSARP